MNTTQVTGEPPVHTYHFLVSGERGTYEASFKVGVNSLQTHCTCGLATSPCWHIEYILAGKTSRIVGGDTALQNEVVSQMERLPDTGKLLRKARKKYAGEMHCRRCCSAKIVQLSNSLVARLATLFRETENHTYYCHKCGWTW